MTPLDNLLAQTVKQNLRGYRCPKCGKSFGKIQALRMHNIRMHTHRFYLGKPQTEEEIREKKRKWNAAMRARNVAMGLTSSGKPRKLPLRSKPFISKTDEYKKRKYKEQRDRYYNMGLNAKGQPFKLSKSGVSNIQKAQQARRAREAGKQRKRLRYVYPLPEEPLHPAFTEPASKPELTPDMKNYMRAQLMHFCPRCGDDLTKWEVKTEPKGTYEQRE